MKKTNLTPSKDGRRWPKAMLLCGLVACGPMMFAMSPTDASRDGLPPTASPATEVTQQTQGRVLTGTVTDAVDGTPLIGATIRLKGTETGVVTDIDGNYSIKVNSSRDVLIVSYIGYKTREVPVEDLAIINIKLQSDNEMLDEVVVVGAGTQKKVSVTGAITAVEGDLLTTSSSSLTTALAGQLAGVMVSTNSGEPGGNSSFYIRGVSTFGGRTEPLILLDDVEISANDLNRIPPESIESFSILKDASATAIYGARGSNGVMIITTKSGAENTKSQINVTVENSFNYLSNFPEFVDGATWMELYNVAQLSRNPNATPRYTQDVIEATRSGVNPYVYPDVDWRDLIFKDMAMSQRANVDIKGGGSRVTYYMGLNMTHDSGLLDSPNYYSYKNNINNMTYNFQSNISYKATSTTKIDLRMNAQIYSRKGPNYSSSDLFKLTLNTNPVVFPAVFPAEEGDTHVRYGNAYLSGSKLYNNPYAYMASSFKHSDENTLNTSLKIKQELDFITKGLSATAFANFKNWSSSSYTRSISPYYYGVESYDPATNQYVLELLNADGSDFISQSNISKGSDRTILLQFQLNYHRRFGKHDVGGMLMYMQRDYKSGVLPHRNQGFSGRFTYDYDQRYLLEFNFGYNGTERLAREDRFEFFPAVSMGWVISNEKFFQRFSDKIDNLKLRASFGLVGNDETGSGAGSYLYRDNVVLNSIGYTTGSAWSLTKKGPQINQYAVANATWERARKLDVGVDLTMFRGLSITADYFHEYRYNILMERGSWPNLFGYDAATPWSNVGAVRSWGAELSVRYKKRFSKDLTLDFRGNFTYVENVYDKMDEPTYEYSWEPKTGTPLQATWGYVADGLFKSEEEIAQSADQTGLGSTPMPGDIKYRDLNGDGVINSHDQCMISEYGGRPRIQYGLGLSVQWKNFDFGVFMNGSAMRKKMITGIHPFMNGTISTSGDKNVFKFIAEDYWTEDNPDAAYPRLGLLNSEIAGNHVNSTFWMRNANFIRLKNIEVGYKYKFCRLYVRGDNLAVFSPFKLWDPELSWNAYPLQRTVTVGVQMDF